MLDLNLLRRNLNETAQALRARGYTLDVAAFGLLESRRKAVQVRTQTLQSDRNAQSKSIGKAKAAGEDIQPLLDAVAQLARNGEKDLKAFKEDMDKYNEQKGQCEKLPKSTMLGLIKLNSEQMRSALMPAPTRCLNELERLLPVLGAEKVRIQRLRAALDAYERNLDATLAFIEKS